MRHVAYSITPVPLIMSARYQHSNPEEYFLFVINSMSEPVKRRLNHASIVLPPVLLLSGRSLEVYSELARHKKSNSITRYNITLPSRRSYRLRFPDAPEPEDTLSEEPPVNMSCIIQRSLAPIIRKTFSDLDKFMFDKSQDAKRLMLFAGQFSIDKA